MAIRKREERERQDQKERKKEKMSAVLCLCTGPQHEGGTLVDVVLSLSMVVKGGRKRRKKMG
jgi:hypothetical protein